MLRSNARAWTSAASASFSRAIAWLMAGRIATPSAVPMIDSGYWLSRSA
jgi:hypothetical protein